MRLQVHLCYYINSYLIVGAFSYIMAIVRVKFLPRRIC